MVPQQVKEYYEKGFAVVPLAPGQKFPPRGFPLRYYQQKKPGWREITTWAENYPNCNWGLVTGKASRLLCLDIDGPSTIWQNLPADLAMTARYNTNRGYHLLFALEEGEDYRHGYLDTNVEVLAGGWLAVAPPSIINNVPRIFETPLSTQLPLPGMLRHQLESLKIHNQELRAVEALIPERLVARGGADCLIQIWKRENLRAPLHNQNGERDKVLWVLYQGLIYFGRHTEEVAQRLVHYKNSTLSSPLSQRELGYIFCKTYILTCEKIRAYVPWVTCDERCAIFRRRLGVARKGDLIAVALKKASGNALKVLLLIIAEDMKPRYNIQRIAQETGLSRTTVYSALAELKDLNLLP